jgi:hypothetical protein
VITVLEVEERRGGVEEGVRTSVAHRTIGPVQREIVRRVAVQAVRHDISLEASVERRQRADVLVAPRRRTGLHGI